MEQNQPSDGVAVVVVPMPAQGHLNQLLHLTRIISTRGIPVYYVGSATHNRQAKDRIHGWDPSKLSNIHFHDFQLPEFITPPPDPQARNNFPVHLFPAFKAAVQVREPLGRLLRDLASRNHRVVVVHDGLMSFAAHEASFVSNAEAYCFGACSAFAVLHFTWEALGRPADEGNVFDSVS